MEYTHVVSVAGMVCNDKDEILLLKSPTRGWEIASVLLVKAILDDIFIVKDKKKPVGVMVAFAVIIALLIASAFVKMPLFTINILAVIVMIIVLYVAHLIFYGLGY